MFAASRPARSLRNGANVTTQDWRGRIRCIVGEITLGINGFFCEQRGRALGIVAVTLGINSLLGIDHPVPIVAFLSMPTSVICGRIALRRGARGLGGIAIALGASGFLLLVFTVVTYLFMLAR